MKKHQNGVIPAKAGIQCGGCGAACVFWITAFAGMTQRFPVFSFYHQCGRKGNAVSRAGKWACALYQANESCFTDSAVTELSFGSWDWEYLSNGWTLWTKWTRAQGDFVMYGFVLAGQMW